MLKLYLRTALVILVSPAGLRGTDPDPRTRCRDHAVTGQLVDPGGDSHLAAARAHSGPDAGAGDPDTGTHARVHGDERRIDTGVHARDTRDLADRGADGTYGIAYPGAREPDFHAGRGTVDHPDDNHRPRSDRHAEVRAE